VTRQSTAGIVLLGGFAVASGAMLFTVAIRKEGCLELAMSVVIGFRISCRLRTSSAPRTTVTQRH